MKRLPPVDQWVSHEPDDAGTIIGVVPGVRRGQEEGPGKWQRMYAVETVHEGAVYTRTSYVHGVEAIDAFDRYPQLAKKVYEALERLLADQLDPDGCEAVMAFTIAHPY